ncbi:MAG: [LysW]-aminoadipate/[LysW]-glutamate kinase [Candidatus Caldarchaeum sp.]|nr:[LysW]-aminoadipate/[LysW]-glutamate kinase [Candidatus Caldarchaeum sp.]MDW8435096.1 [LysW]-aminoadipate/[LysW]-glutamate kinase [Candidatus Caldarchaeum sp.]
MIVVKAGGRALDSNRDKILDSVAANHRRGVVFVHGGGDIVSRYEKRLGIEPKIVVSPSGVRSRLTDSEELEVYTMVMAGKLGKEITAYLNSRGVRAVNLSGVDGSVMKAQRKKKLVIVDERGRKRIVDGGFTGTITYVDAGFLESLINLGLVLVFSPLALGDEGELLNVDGDSAAYAIAAALKAEKLYLLTDVDGVFLDGQIVKRISSSEATQILDKIGPGMNRKLMNAVKAVESGVTMVHICSGLVDDPIAAADGGSGTVVV